MLAEYKGEIYRADIEEDVVCLWNNPAKTNKNVKNLTVEEFKEKWKQYFVSVYGR